MDNLKQWGPVFVPVRFVLCRGRVVLVSRSEDYGILLATKRNNNAIART